MENTVYSVNTENSVNTVDFNTKVTNVYNKCFTPLVGVGIKRGLSEAVAKDLVQDTFIHCIEKFEPEANEKMYQRLVNIDFDFNIRMHFRSEKTANKYKETRPYFNNSTNYLNTEDAETNPVENKGKVDPNFELTELNMIIEKIKPQIKNETAAKIFDYMLDASEIPTDILQQANYKILKQIELAMGLKPKTIYWYIRTHIAPLFAEQYNF